MIQENNLIKEMLVKKIAGEVVVSEKPGKVLRKWRELMKISQKELAEKVGMTSSVISDYESGRRKSPGIKIIRKLVEGLLEIEVSRGGELLKQFSIETGSIVNVILDMREFIEPIKIEKFCEIINAELILGGKKEIFGYTIIDSLKAIVNFPPSELVKLYGSTTERAMIFTKVSSGRSPLVAIKVTGLKPALVVLHGTENVDKLAKKIAEVENIPLAVCKEKDIKKVISNLRENL